MKVFCFRLVYFKAFTLKYQVLVNENVQIVAIRGSAVCWIPRVPPSALCARQGSTFSPATHTRFTEFGWMRGGGQKALREDFLHCMLSLLTFPPVQSVRFRDASFAFVCCVVPFQCSTFCRVGVPIRRARRYTPANCSRCLSPRVHAKCIELSDTTLWHVRFVEPDLLFVSYFSRERQQVVGMCKVAQVHIPLRT